MAGKFHRDKEGKKALLLETLLSLIPERGFSSIKIADIAERSGVSVGTVYRYYPEGMRSLLRAILEKDFQSMMDADGFSSLNADNLSAVLESMIRRHISAHRENKATHLAVARALLDYPELLEEYNGELDRLLRESAASVRASNPFLERVPAERFTEGFFLIHGLLEATVHRHAFTRALFPSDEELVRFLRDVILERILG